MLFGFCKRMGAVPLNETTPGICKTRILISWIQALPGTYPEHTSDIRDNLRVLLIPRLSLWDPEYIPSRRHL